MNHRYKSRKSKPKCCSYICGSLYLPRYYNHKDREFYYHTAVRVTSPAPVGNDEDVRDSEEIVLDFGGGDNPSSTSLSASPSPLSSSSSPFRLYYDPYGPVVPPRLVPIPPEYHPVRQPGGYHHYLYQVRERDRDC